MILVANFLKKSLLFFLFFLGACSSNNEVVSISGETFGTFYDIKFEKSQYNIKKINDEINNIFISINQCCSTYKNDSLVSFKRDSKNTDLFKEEVKYYFQEVVKISEKANKTVEGFILFDDYDYFNEIRVEGMKNKNFWKIGIENPLPNQTGIFKPFEIKQSLSIATSGNYRNPGHIVGIEGSKIDQNVLSISVMDKKSTAYADALATGLFAL